METPELATKLVGTTARLGGGLFSHKKNTEYQDFNVLDWRWGSAKIINTKTLEPLHPTVEFLVKNKDMKRSRWTRGFPVREVDLKNWDEI